MIKANPSDPKIVSLSTLSYRLLISCYPAPFRSQYGPHMAQVFRDSCLDTYRRSGLQGLASLWALALFDWFKIMIEERLPGETDMTQSKFIRASGWGLILAPIALLSTFLSESDLQNAWYRVFGVPTTISGLDRLQSLTGFVAQSNFFFAVLFITIGLLGLRARYGEPAGSTAKAALRVGIFGGAVALVCITGMAVNLENLLPLRNISIAIMFAGMLVFGLAALREKLMPRWNVLPVLAGVWWPLIVVDAYVVPLGISRLGPVVPFWFTFTIFLLISVSLALMGFVLQSDAPREAAAV